MYIWPLADVYLQEVIVYIMPLADAFLQEVSTLREEIRAEESRYHYLHSMMAIVDVQQKRVHDEMKAYMSNDQAEKKKTFRYGKGVYCSVGLLGLMTLFNSLANRLMCYWVQAVSGVVFF